MVIELFTSSGATLVCQAIASVHLKNRNVGRTLLEGLVRELLEYHLHRVLSKSHPDQLMTDLKTYTYRIEADLRSDLEHRGVTLSSLELRPIRVDRDPEQMAPGSYRWVEFLSPPIGTRDGFQVVADTVALVKAPENYMVDPVYANRFALAAVSDAFLSTVGGLAVEDLLSSRNRWTGETLHRAQETLDQSRLHLEYLAVTEVSVRPAHDEFRAGRAGDPFLNLFRQISDGLLKEDESHLPDSL